MSFFNELKRRNVVRMGMLYIVASWVLLQISDVIFEPLGVPPWVFRMMMSMLALGFPFALVIAWIFELTPEGLKRERDIDRSQSIVHETGHRMNTVIVVLLVLAIGGLVADRLIPESSDQGREVIAAPGAVDSPGETVPEAPPAAENENAIAVLPFVNMSGDPENEYFSDGLTEELLNALVQLGGLQVTGRTSSFAFKGQSQDVREIGRLLNVASVLEGSVRKSGNRVRITAQLIKASDGYHLWSDTFDRELDDIFAIQAEIAGQVSKALHLTLLGPGETNQPVLNPAREDAEAYEEYLRGMYVLQRNPDNEVALDKAKSHFSRALEIDPAYVDAHWGMFMAWDRINRNGFVPYRESAELMENYAAELQELAPASERALNAVARNALRNYNYQRAAEYLQEAVRLYPGSATIQTGYASALLLLNPANQPDSSIEAREEAALAIAKAIQLDPLSLGVLRAKANWLLQLGNCSELEKTLKRALELEPGAGRFRYMLASCIYAYEGDISQALAIVEPEPLGYARMTLMAILHHKLGNQALAQQYLDELYLTNGDSASYQYGQIHAQWGETETALTWLETALEIRDPGIILSVWDPLLDPLRGEPRFQKILEAAGYR